MFLLAFSNDRDDYLPMITRERKNIYKILRDHHDKGYIDVRKEEATSVEDIFDSFRRYHDRIAIFHYGGHASGTHLQLETAAGDPQMAHAAGLAQLMGQQKELKLVFLNGCATANQVALLLSAGVKAVIATSVPINDNMAVEFAEQFYNNLVSKATIREAFETARAFIDTRYGPDRTIDVYRDRSWQTTKKKKDSEEVPWGLYINEESPEVLEWKLPTTRGSSTIASITTSGDTQANTQLIGCLFKEVSQNPGVAYLIKAIEESKDIRLVRQAIFDSFPMPVGEQLRRLFASSKIDVPRLRQLVATYKITVELLFFTMLSQFWEVKFRNPEIVINDDYLVEFNSFFSLSADNYRTFNYVKLIEAIAGIFKENNIKCFVSELNDFKRCFPDQKDGFFEAYQFMEDVKTEILEDSVKAGEVELFCLQAEKHLATILSRLAFFVKYKLASIKWIRVERPRHREPKYFHRSVILDKVSVGVLDGELKDDSFADNNSVILLKNVRDVGEYLSLSPFVIDENALNGHPNSKLFFYSYPDTIKGEYHYKFVENEEEELVVSDTNCPLIKEQFEEFKRDVFR